MADLTSDFPRAELLAIRDDAFRAWKDRYAIAGAIAAYDALSDRYVLKTTEQSVEIGNLRAEVQRLEDAIEDMRAIAVPLLAARISALDAQLQAERHALSACIVY